MVSTMEGMMPALLGQGRILHYYPLGLATADYVVLEFSHIARDGTLLSGAVTYLGGQNLAELNKCLNSRLWAAGYKLEKTVSPGAATDYGIAILKRTKEGNANGVK